MTAAIMSAVVLPYVGRGSPHVPRTMGGVTCEDKTGRREGETTGSATGDISAAPYLPPPPPSNYDDDSLSSPRNSESDISGAPSTDDDLLTAARTARRQLGAHMTGPHDSIDSEITEGRTVGKYWTHRGGPSSRCYGRMGMCKNR